jgi:hypothetical protein
MAVKADSLKVGACFRFKTAVRRITRIERSEVHWEYADHKRRAGRLGGVQWLEYFRSEAIEEAPDPVVQSECITLRTGETIPVLKESIPIVLETNAPRRWAFVDLWSGEVWSHDGSQFEPIKGPGTRAVKDAISFPGELEAELISTFKAEGRVAAVKLHRARTGSSLAEAVAAIKSLGL